MSGIASKIASSIIIAGFFIITVLLAVSYSSVDKGFYIILFFIAIYLFLFGFATGQNVISPVKKILENAGEIAKGNLSSRVYIKTKDELEDLAGILNEIADKLQESKSAIEATEKNVDIKVKARTEALEETITALEQKVKNRTLELDKIVNDSQKVQELIKAKELEISELKRQISSLKPKQRLTKNKNARVA